MHTRYFGQWVFLFVYILAGTGITAQPAGNSGAISGLTKPDSALHFIVMGDWGRYGAAAQQKVADVMGIAAAALRASFIITAGDNFYPSGVADINDPHWDRSFEKVYKATSLQVPWYPVLGNHDYILNPDAQVAYSRKGKRWHMPARYYDTSFATGHDSVLFVFLDTDPIEKEFLKAVYDSLKYPANGVTRQLQWLDQVLASSTAKWKIVVGHNPLHTGGSRRHSSRTRKMRNILQPFFKRYAVDFYLSGHEHQLEYLKPGGATHYIISGAASSTGHLGWLKWHRRFAARKKGFASLSIGPQGVLLQFISDNTRVIYRKMIMK